MFGASEHSMIFLVSSKPRNDRVISWIREKVMETRTSNWRVCCADDLYAACDAFNTTAVQFAARAKTLNRNK